MKLMVVDERKEVLREPYVLRFGDWTLERYLAEPPESQSWEFVLGEAEIEGVRRPVLVAIGEEGERPLIDYTTPKVLGFKVKSIAGKLERAVAIEYVGTGGSPVKAAVDRQSLFSLAARTYCQPTRLAL